MKKILITTSDLNVGGVETSLIFLVNNLVKQKYEVDLLLYESGKLINKLDDRVNILYYENYYKNPKNNILYRINKNIKVKSLIKKYKSFDKKYDISIAYNGFDNYLDLLAISVDSNLKIIWDHNDFYSAVNTKKFKLLYKLMYKFMGSKFKYFDKIVCVSEYTRRNFVKMFKNEKKTIVCHNYIDQNYIQKLLKNNTKIQMQSGVFNIVSVGRLTKLKNFDKLVELASELKKHYTNFHIYIIGNGEEYEHLTSKIYDLKINEYVSLLGEQHDELYSIMSQADLLISLSEYESFGNVLIEGLILGIPYLSNINSGSRDIYDNYKSGCIVKNEFILDNLLEIIDGKKIKVTFDINKYNDQIDEKLLEILK